MPTTVPVTVTEQLETPVPPATSAQEAVGLNESDAEDEKVTVPAGLDLVPVGSTSVTVAVTVPPCPALSGLGETATAAEVARLLTFSVRLVALAWKTPETPA